MNPVIAEMSKNHILAGLPDGERDWLLPFLELLQVHLGERILNTGEPIRFLHFPIDAAISLMNAQDDEHMVDVTITGKEGCNGASIVQGDDRSPYLAMVQIDGAIIRVEASVVMGHLLDMPYFEAALARYNSLLLRHSAVSVGCSQFHSVPQRLARWLATHCHRTERESFPFQTSFLAVQAGVDPTIADEVLNEFQRHGIVRMSRNNVTIINHDALTNRACQCFALAKEATEEYLAALKDIRHTYGDTRT